MSTRWLPRSIPARPQVLLSPRPMFAGAPPSSPDPLPSRIVALSDPVAMQSPPPPAPPAAEEDEERPWPPMRMKLFTYATYCVFGGMDSTGDKLLVACGVIHYLNIIVTLLSFYTDGEQARFWTLVSRVTQFLCYVFTTFITCVFIRYYMRVDGEYHVTFDPPQQHLEPAPAAAAEQLPPPPPEMDMC